MVLLQDFPLTKDLPPRYTSILDKMYEKREEGKQKKEKRRNECWRRKEKEQRTKNKERGEGGRIKENKLITMQYWWESSTIQTSPWSSGVCSLQPPPLRARRTRNRRRKWRMRERRNLEAHGGVAWCACGCAEGASCASSLMCSYVVWSIWPAMLSPQKRRFVIKSIVFNPHLMVFD